MTRPASRTTRRDRPDAGFGGSVGRIRPAGLEISAEEDAFPYVRVGDGHRTLVVLPGVGDAMFAGRYPPIATWILRSYLYRFVDRNTVYLLSRPRGLPDGQSIESMADDYASVLERLGPASILGISMGGLIGQAIAIRHPPLVDRLVLADSAARLDPDAVAAVRRLERYAEDHDWAAIRAELATAMFSDWRALAYPSIIRTVGRFVQPRPAVPADVRISLAAIRNFDARDRLGAIGSPTLVIGGSADPYFTASRMRETAEGLSDGRLSLIHGAKHAAFHERKGAFDRRVEPFLDA